MKGEWQKNDSFSDYEFSNVREQRILKQKQDKLQSQIAKQQQRQQQQQQPTSLTQSQKRQKPGREEDDSKVLKSREEGDSEIAGLSLSDLAGTAPSIFKSEGGTTDFDVDPLYDDEFYNEFIEAACLLLGNLTTSGTRIN